MAHPVVLLVVKRGCPPYTVQKGAKADSTARKATSEPGTPTDCPTWGVARVLVPHRTGFTWHRSQSAIGNATLVWQTPHDSPDEIPIIEVFFVPLFVLG